MKLCEFLVLAGIDREAPEFAALDCGQAAVDFVEPPTGLYPADRIHLCTRHFDMFVGKMGYRSYQEQI